MNKQFLIENICIHFEKEYYALAESGSFALPILGKDYWFKKQHLTKTVLDRVGELFNNSSGIGIKENFLSIYGDVYEIKAFLKRPKNIKVKKYLCTLLAEESYYHERLRLGYTEKSGNIYVYRKIPSFTIQHQGKPYTFNDATLATRMSTNQDALDFSPLIIMNSYAHPGLPSLGKEMQTLCLGDIKYEEIKKQYRAQPLKQLLHLFSIGEQSLKSGAFKNVYQPLERFQACPA